MKYTMEILEGTYSKLKAKIFYDNTAMIDKLKIAQFEADNLSLKLETVSEIINEKNYDQFERMIERIDIYPFVKKKVKNGYDLNFMIDIPIELHIIDTLWTIYLAEYIHNTNSFSEHIYGNLIDRKNMFNNDTRHINWDNKYLFERYVKGYNKWLEKLEFKLETHRNIHDNMTVVVSDFKRFYYSTGNPFEKVNEYYEFIENHEWLTEIIKRIYDQYRVKLLQYSKIKINDGSLPIGLSSSMLLSNLYLHDFDESIVHDNRVLFFGRYVDDMILILRDEHDKRDALEFLRNKLEKTIVNSKIQLNDDKTEVFNLSSNKYLNEYDKLMMFLFQKQINYYSNEDEENLSFRRYVNINKKKLNRQLIFKKIENEDSLLNLELTDSILFMNYIYTYVNFKDNTINDMMDKIDKSFDDNFKASMWKEFYRWFSYFKNKPDKFETLSNSIERLIYTINKIKLNEVKKEKLSELRKKLVNTYTRVHEISKTLSNSNMFGNTQTTLMLKNARMINSISPVRYFIENYKNDKLTNNDKFYIEHFENSVQFIHLWEILTYDQLVNVIFGRKKTIKQSINDFIRINKLTEFDYIKEEKVKTVSGFDAKKIYIDYQDDLDKDYIISHPNVCLDTKEGEPLNSWNSGVDFPDTFKLLDNILEAKDNGTNILVLPELYLNYSWLHLIGLSAQNFNMIIYAGMKALVKNKQFFNLMLSMHPFKDINKRRNTLVTIREKNFYSYEEIDWCNKNFYTYANHKKPVYHMVNHNGISYSDYLCFEVTDIWSRALFKGLVDVIVIPMLNKDTSYFDSIILSLSRDLSSMVITSNSATWGNSSIILPKKTHERIITEFKGGFNQYLVSTKFNVKSLINYNNEFEHPKDGDEFKPHPANSKYYNK
ncbi:reverse transcriptase domain-containing protein [Acholeplasma manati]|uniref:Reverse transcriptase domain-containing protein n=1 Tax=Paracholeplasma manati TaxID=591373 RepID=A0ABT2Y3B5_9MOLU|nr:reverse transcriptase domain-containing protein [Paracholeplasma manati]MCV2231226.1 reverse transcriptase domain-containing protein [Paracholeplasma manati]